MVLLISNLIVFNIGLVCFTFALTVSFLATSSINKSYSKVLLHSSSTFIFYPPSGNMKNKDIIEHYRSSKNKHTTCKWFAEQYTNSEIPKKSLNNKCIRIIEQYQKINKTQNSKNFQTELHEFLTSEIELPKTTPKAVKTTHKSSEYCLHENVARTLATELSQSNKELEELTKYRKYRIQLHNYNTNKILLRKTKEQLKKANDTIKKQTDDINSIHSKYVQIKKRLKACRSRETYYNSQYQKSLQNKTTIQEHIAINQVEIAELANDLSNKSKECNDLQINCDYLSSLLNDQNADTIYTFQTDSKRYDSSVEICIYKLLECHVGPRHISNVIAEVLKLAGKKANQLPSVSTLNDMNIRRLAVCQKQVSELKESENTCLYTDETSRRGEKYGGYHLSDSSGDMYVLGLRDLPTKSASDTLNVFREILDDLDSICKNNDNKVSHGIIRHITSTMSDQASCEKKFNQLLATYRQEILPLVLENYEELSEEERTSLGRLYNFFCGLHPLIHFADVCTTTMGTLEKVHFNNEVPTSDLTYKSSDRSATERLVRTSCKALARGGDEKSGAYGSFKLFVQPFLKEKKLLSIPLVPFRGSRFNILFSESAGLYFLHQKAVSFLETYPRNKLLESVFHDLKEPYLIAGLKALGLICYLVTSPLWCLVEQKDIGIVEMGKYYTMLVEFLKSCSEDGSTKIDDFMRGEYLPFAEKTAVKKDCIFECLMAESEFNLDVATLLPPLFKSMLGVANNMYKDLLPGGKYNHLVATEDMVWQTRGVQKHNKFCEGVFGYLDHLIRHKPNVTTISMEAYIMFVYNKTYDWLQEKSEEERTVLMREARKGGRKLREQYKQRKKLIEEQRLRNLNEKMEKERQKEQRKIQRMENMTTEIVFFSLWQSQQEVESSLQAIHTKNEKEKALKAQLRFRQKVFKQKTDTKDAYTFSKKMENGRNRPCTIDELKVKVISLVSSALVMETHSTDNCPLLVGKKITHKFDQEAGTVEWYEGKVISQVPGFGDYYNCVYDSEATVVYTYRLAEDYAAGNLKIVL